MAGLIYWSSREEGITQLDAFLAYAGEYASDLRYPLNRTKSYLQRLMEEQFDTEGERSGHWVPLAERYAEWKDQHGGAGKLILDLTGEMKGVTLADEDWKIDETRALYVNPSRKAGWHQTGAPNRQAYTQSGEWVANPLPARPILDIDEYDYQAIEDIFYDWLKELRSEEPGLRTRPSINFPQIFS